ncbi:MAG: nodulation protein NfeD, partial [Verrucomicrobium sp.]
ASSIGAATPISGGGEKMDEAERAKMNSAFMAMARTAVITKGHNPDIIEAMIDKDVGLKVGDVEIFPKGRLVTLDQQQATKTYDGKPLLAKAIVRDLDELVKLEGLKGQMVVAEPKGFELVAIWITKYAAILLLIGIAGGYLEMQHPGFGIPGIISAAAFGLFFFGHYVAGSLVGYETVFIFFIGVLFLIIELFVFPGHLIFGLLGLALVFGSLIYTMSGWDITVPEGGTFPVRFEDYIVALRNLGLAFTGALLLIIIFMRYFPSVGPFQRLILHTAVGGEQASIEGEGQRKASKVEIGATGTTRSALRPYGHVDFNGTMLEAMVEGDYVAPGTAVKVRSISGGKITVQRA